MWTVKSEAGRLRTVAIHGSWYRDRVACPGLQPFQNSTLYERGRRQLSMMADSMRAHGVKVYEWSEVFKEVLEDATLKEKGEIIESVWGGPGCAAHALGARVEASQRRVPPPPLL